MRNQFGFSHVTISHRTEPPIGAGFGTSGSGAIGTALAISDLFGLKLTLAQATRFAHSAEIICVTGLGTVVSLTSGMGAIGLVTEPGAYGVGRVDAFPEVYDDYTLICASFGHITKSAVLNNSLRRKKINEFGRETLEAIMHDRTPEALLSQSRIFAEKTSLASPELLELADRAMEFGAVGATQNMIGNGIHCLVLRADREKFLDQFSRIVPIANIFETNLYHGGPKLVKEMRSAKEKI